MAKQALEQSSDTESKLRNGSMLMALVGVGFIGYAIIYFIHNFTDAFLEFGLTKAQVDVGKSEIIAFSPSLFNYISHLHVAISGFIAATGLAVVGLSLYGVRKGQMWAWVFAVASLILGLVIAIPLHYVYGIATVTHLGLTSLATLIFIVGALISLNGLLAQKK